MRLPEDAERYKRLQEVPENIQHAPARVAHAKHADYGNRERENKHCFEKKSNTLPHVWHTPNTRITEIGNARTTFHAKGGLQGVARNNPR